MKIYISADIEGITGITHWDELDESSFYPGMKQISSTNVLFAI